MNLGTIKNRNSMKRILKGIRNGEAIVMALDQNMKSSVGVFIDWMGRPACSVFSAAYVALKTGAPVLAGFMRQIGPDEFELVLTEEVEWEEWPDDREKEILINAQKQADAIQKIIYEYPELWFWIHRRWNIQPRGVRNPYK
jgi:KDO2-lipid IV(A) lauroyltransferase